MDQHMKNPTHIYQLAEFYAARSPIRNPDIASPHGSAQSTGRGLDPVDATLNTGSPDPAMEQLSTWYPSVPEGRYDLRIK
ncbi:hypothetical protein MJO29_000017 [Puccinia striiformis f. sp. tritici]|nr:hypothetical protein MJO29_000017 [Puccinia striiformis f. sp. tritici]